MSRPESQGCEAGTGVEDTRAREAGTLSWGRLVADFQSLSSRMRVQRGKRMEIPSAVCASDLENSAPVISHTAAFCQEFSRWLGRQACPQPARSNADRRRPTAGRWALVPPRLLLLRDPRQVPAPLWGPSSSVSAWKEWAHLPPEQTICVCLGDSSSPPAHTKGDSSVLTGPSLGGTVQTPILGWTQSVRPRGRVCGAREAASSLCGLGEPRPLGWYLWVWDYEVRIVDLVDFQPAGYLAGILEEKRCCPGPFPSQNET